MSSWANLIDWKHSSVETPRRAGFVWPPCLVGLWGLRPVRVAARVEVTSGYSSTDS